MILELHEILLLDIPVITLVGSIDAKTSPSTAPSLSMAATPLSPFFAKQVSLISLSSST